MSTVELSGTRDEPLVVVGPSLGTSVATLWGPCAELLGDRFHVVGWDLPGHGRERHPIPEQLTVAQLARAVLDAVDRVLVVRGEPEGAFGYAGDSVGGAVGLQLLVDHPGRVSAAVLACTGARIGEPNAWDARRALVLNEGVEALVESSRERWFGPGFEARHPARASGLVADLVSTDSRGYAAVCTALAGFDLRHRLREVTSPVLAVAGSADVSTPPALLRDLVSGVPQGRYAELAGVGHQAPLEAPHELAGMVGKQLFISALDQ